MAKTLGQNARGWRQTSSIGSRIICMSLGQTAPAKQSLTAGCPALDRNCGIPNVERHYTTQVEAFISHIMSTQKH